MFNTNKLTESTTTAACNVVYVVDHWDFDWSLYATGHDYVAAFPTRFMAEAFISQRKGAEYEGDDGDGDMQGWHIHEIPMCVSTTDSRLKLWTPSGHDYPDPFESDEDAEDGED